MDKQELYNKAKDAYYNGGEPIMSDTEFDELESELGLENQSYVGSKSKNYTVRHPLIMGSISKINVKFDENGNIDFNKYSSEVEKYLKKSNKYYDDNWCFEITPKLDGVSFEVCISSNCELLSCSTRGDGNYGSDIKVWFEPEWEKNFKNKIKPWLTALFLQTPDDFLYLKTVVIRGEVLIKKSIFAEKYSDKFTIPRSFVSGVLNQIFEGTSEQLEMRDDLSWVCYDYRFVFDNGVVTECGYDSISPGQIIDNRQVYYKEGLNHFDHIYNEYDNYRKNVSPFELDGFVIKPICKYRLQDLTRTRQEDCIAVKFTPEIVETQIEEIIWSVSKNGEYTPVAICKEVILGGKKVSRVSLHNYDYIVRNGCGDGGLGVDGATIKISLAGDIIPTIMSTVKPCEHPIFSIPIDSYIVEDEKSGCLHLMKNMSNDDIILNKFLTSVRSLKIDGIGEKVATNLFNAIDKVPNILEFMTDSSLKIISEVLGNSKSTTNIITALTEKRKKLTLPEVIESCGIYNCGTKNSLWLAKKISGIDVSNDGIPSTIIDFYENGDMCEIMNYINMFNVPMLKEEKSDGIPVILTGKPTQYSTKKDFLMKNPQYVETTSWKDCKILFTDSLESTSSKMQKAKKNGVEIKLY